MTTQEQTKSIVSLETKVAAHDERIDGIEKRLCTTEESVKEQNRILVVIERLTNGIDTLNYKVGELGTKVDGFGRRLSDIELEPAVRWKTLIGDIIKLVVAALIGYGLAQIGLK